jgi:hypothetical protein
MKKLQLLLALTLLSVQFSFGQNRIEILVNGKIQPISNNPIRVLNFTDTIEFRVYYDNSATKENLIDNLQVERCNIVQNQDVQQQQQRTNSKPDTRQEFDTISFEPTDKKSFFSFKFLVNQVTYCENRRFFLSPIFNKTKSKIKTFKNYQSKYKLYFAHD